MLSFRDELAAHRMSTGLASRQNASVVRDTHTRARRRCENEAFAAFALRIIRAHGRRVAAGDPEDLATMLACHKEMTAAISLAVRTARAELGWTWADVGRAAGITRASAHERWGRA